MTGEVRSRGDWISRMFECLGAYLGTLEGLVGLGWLWLVGRSVDLCVCVSACLYARLYTLVLAYFDVVRSDVESKSSTVSAG